MVLGYVIASTSFAALCSIIWLLLDGTVLGAIGVYMGSGQLTLWSLIAYVALRPDTSGETLRD